MFERLRDLFADLIALAPAERAAGEAQSGADPAGVSPATLIDRIATAERVVAAVQASQRRDVAAFAAARLAADDAMGLSAGRLRGRSIGTELGLAVGASPAAGASRAALAAAAVEDHPALSALADQGWVSEFGLRLVTRETEILPADLCRVVDAGLAADVESEVAATGTGMSPARLASAALRRVLAADPEAATRRARAARARRAFSVTDRRDGTATLWARLRAEEAVAVHQMVESHARCLRADGADRSLNDLMCDLLVEATTGMTPTNVTSTRDDAVSDANAPVFQQAKYTERPEADEGSVDPAPQDAAWDDLPTSTPAPTPTSVWPPPSSGQPDVLTRHQRWLRARPRVELQVVLAASTVLGLDDQPGMLRGYGALPAGVVRDILDTASTDALAPSTVGPKGGRADAVVWVRRLLCDPVDGRLLTMDPTARCYRGPVRHLAMWRDQACRVSGARAVHVDHVIPYAAGGPTTPGNGQGLSVGMHVLRDHPDIAVRTVRTTDDRYPAALVELRVAAPDVEWTLPTGHSYRLRPPPALGWGSSTPTDIAQTPIRADAEPDNDAPRLPRTAAHPPPTHGSTVDRPSRPRRRPQARARDPSSSSDKASARVP